MRATAAIRTLLARLLTCLAAASLSDVVRAEGRAGEVGVNVNGEPRFVVKALNFQAFDETGFDFLGSDEVVFTFGTRRYVIVSNEFGRINSDGERSTACERKRKWHRTGGRQRWPLRSCLEVQSMKAVTGPLSS